MKTEKRVYRKNHLIIPLIPFRKRTRLSHEEKVARFYSCGTETRAYEADGFLSFGYWRDDTKNYHEASKNLLEYFIKTSNIKKPEKILNVACGYGAETFRMFEHLKPEKIYSIDITDPHIEFAKKRASELGYSDRIHFRKMDACKTDFPSEMFTHILGIEGPAHFNTRVDFFRESYRLLKKGGALILTDIIQADAHSQFAFSVGKRCAVRWHMPQANWSNAATYRRQLEEAGFRVEILNIIGDKVYPGFCRYNIKIRSIYNAVKTRGFFIGIGLTFISWLLGYVYRKKVIDYVYVKAVK
jgi:erythromycin 3''-O-methyltransferase